MTGVARARKSPRAQTGLLVLGVLVLLVGVVVLYSGWFPPVHTHDSWGCIEGSTICQAFEDGEVVFEGSEDQILAWIQQSEDQARLVALALIGLGGLASFLALRPLSKTFKRPPIENRRGNLTGWALILVFGGGVALGVTNVVYLTATGYYTEGDSTTVLIILGVLAVFASVPLMAGIRMVRRASRASGKASPNRTRTNA